MRGWVEEEEEGGTHLQEKGIAIAMILENYEFCQAASSNVLACYVYAQLSAAFQRCPETFLPVTLFVEAYNVPLLAMSARRSTWTCCLRH
jgi:hypothetical protein